MLISRNWLQNFFEATLPPTDALVDALTFHAFEIDGVEKRNADDILDVKVTPNRGHDCLSHRGIAKEVSAILNLPLKEAVDPLGKGFTDRFDAAPRTDKISITIEDPALCPRYIASYITGVKVGPSPEWLKNSLEAIGQRSINNIVDATNLVMFNTGQPVHAFDAGKLTQKEGKFHIVVRKARDGEKLLALDNKEYVFKDSMLVIADGNADVAVGVAGIKGGTPAGITEATTDVVIEVANFSGVSVRKTAQALKLRTDASARFEQGISPELDTFGMQNTIELIKNIAGGELVGVADVYPAPWVPTPVSVSLTKINQILGTNLVSEDVKNVFTRLGFDATEAGGVFTVVPPFERLDLTIAEDLVEEVGRIVGYDAVPSVPLPVLTREVEVNKEFQTAEHVRKELTDAGYSEVVTSVFSEKGERAVLNKVDSVRPYMRANVTDGLNEALKKNIPNKDLLGLKEVKLFEIGTVWKAGHEEVVVGTVTEKEKAQEEPLSMHEQKGLATYEDLPLSTTERYKTFSKYPYIVRDVALWTPVGTMSADVLQLITNEAGELLVRSSLFDEFTKGEKVSYAFRLVFQSFERTLTEVEVNAIMEKIYASLKAKGFEIR